MKRFLSFIIGITLSICLFTGCGKKQDDKYKMEYEQRNGYTPHYTDIWVNKSLLRYTPIDGMKVLKVEDLKSEQDIGQTIRGQLPQSEYKVEFVAQLESDPSVMIQIVSYKFTQDVPNIIEFEKAIESQSKYRGYGHHSSVKLGTRSFNENLHLKINDMRLGWYYENVDDYYVSVIVTAYDREEVKKILSGFSTIGA